MGKPRITFSSGDIPFSFRDKARTAAWLEAVAASHKRSIGTLSYVFVSDDYLLKINKEFLRHNTYTDIITFDYSGEAQVSEANKTQTSAASKTQSSAARTSVASKVRRLKEERAKRFVSGEIYISLDRVADNATKYGVTRKDELHRVIAHGLLHLCGLKDKSEPERKRMRAAEEKALSLRK